ncbi:hypothetical protein GCM10020000_69590 [Streptomyces olivoverticillatus]
MHLTAVDIQSGIAVEIEDAGVGLTDEARRRTDRVLSKEGGLDLDDLGESPRLGLAVVSQLANTYDFLVSLRPSAYGGVRAVLVIPPNLITASKFPGGDIARPPKLPPAKKRRRPGSIPVQPSAAPIMDSPIPPPHWATAACRSAAVAAAPRRCPSAGPRRPSGPRPRPLRRSRPYSPDCGSPPSPAASTGRCRCRTRGGRPVTTRQTRKSSQVTQQPRFNMDWMLKDLATSVPQTRHVIVLSSDGLRMAQHGTDTEVADRLAAACAGLQSLSSAIASEFPHGDGQMRLVVIEVDGGFFYLMAAGAGAYLAVLADDDVDAGLMGMKMRDLVARIGSHLTSPPRVSGSVT